MGITFIDELPIDRLRGARVLVRINSSYDLPSAIPTLEFLINAGTRPMIAAGAPGTVGDSLAEDLRHAGAFRCATSRVRPRRRAAPGRTL